HPGCAKRFTRKTSLRKHMLTHSPARHACRSPARSTASDIRSATVSPAHSPQMAARCVPALPHYHPPKQLAPIVCVRPASPHGSVSPTPTACHSPAMRGADGLTLPSISTLLA
ncbi:hypothetical protein IWQ56_000257, partial [Coemansia nantahalensis]